MNGRIFDINLPFFHVNELMQMFACVKIQFYQWMETNYLSQTFDEVSWIYAKEWNYHRKKMTAWMKSNPSISEQIIAFLATKVNPHINYWMSPAETVLNHMVDQTFKHGDNSGSGSNDCFYCCLFNQTIKQQCFKRGSFLWKKYTSF